MLVGEFIVQERLGNIGAVKALLKEAINSAKGRQPATTAQNINLQSLEDHKKEARDIVALTRELGQVVEMLCEYNTQLQKIVHGEADVLREFVSKLKVSLEEPAAGDVFGGLPDNIYGSPDDKSYRDILLGPGQAPTATCRQLQARARVASCTAPAEPEWRVARRPREYERISIAEGVHVKAVPVQDFESVADNGKLYYVEPLGHFAIYISKILFHGNVGVIFTNGKSPRKIKDCRMDNSCEDASKCSYYHDPLTRGDSRDVRNYTQNNWLYAPSLQHQRNYSRKLGSVDNLNQDLARVNPRDAAMMRDQTMHDILLSIIATEHVKKTRSY